MTRVTATGRLDAPTLGHDVPGHRASVQGPSGPVRDVMLPTFRSANRHVMPPLLNHRLVGPWVGSPLAGYFLTLTTTGRRSGLPPRTPLNYAILGGRNHVLSGFGVRADWYRNLSADPRVIVALPRRVVKGIAAPVLGPVEGVQAALAVARTCGFALVFEGMNPLTATDTQLRARLAGRPVVRITSPEPVRPGRHDPSSRWRVLPPAIGLLGCMGAGRALKRR